MERKRVRGESERREGKRREIRGVCMYFYNTANGKNGREKSAYEMVK